MQVEYMRSYGKWVSGKRSKWVTVMIWIIVTVLLSIAWPGVNQEVNNNAGDLPIDAPSVLANQIEEREFPNASGIPALIMWHREDGLKDDDFEHLHKLSQSLESHPLPYQSFIPPFHMLPIQALQTQSSADLSTFIMPIFFSNEADVDQLKDSIDQLKKQIKLEIGADPFKVKVDSITELSARITGPVGISIDATELFMNADVSLLIATVILVLIILLLIYRSPILALIPLIAVGFAYGVISPILGFMAHQGWITVDSQGTSIMTVLLFGAGTDYCLFLIARFRQILMSEESKFKALIKAISDSSGAIAMSGFTVVVAMLALIFAQFGAYHRFAVPFSISIFVMGVASLTLVPALLAIFGRASFFPFIPRTPEMMKERALKKGKAVPELKTRRSESKLGALVVRKPWSIILLTVLFLGGFALVSTQITYTYDLLSSFPNDMESREGFTMIEEKFSPGQLAPVQIMIDSQGKEIDLGDRLANLTYVDQVSIPKRGAENQNILLYEVEYNVNPYSIEAMDQIPHLRSVAVSALEDAGIDSPEQHVWVGGQTATQFDTKLTGDRDTRVIMPIIIGMIALLLLIYLRSITAMVYLVATVLLSYFSALGLGWLIVHYVMGVDAISGAIPLYSFVFLVALGEDYNIFMISSIWQKRKHMPLRQAIQEGVGQTSSVITSAGLILAGTFAVLATLPIQVLVQFGIITAIGILLDTFIVRPFLVPAITVVLGKWAFWPGSYQQIEETIKAE